jgi:ElaB/YqjD/DUF883 family membrane-anchored ribosome-binding protein
MNTNIDLQKTDSLKKTVAAEAEGIGHDFAKNAKAYSEGALDTISEGYQTGLAWVKKNPLQAAAIGVGVGFLLGALVRRFNDRKSS